MKNNKIKTKKHKHIIKNMQSLNYQRGVKFVLQIKFTSLYTHSKLNKTRFLVIQTHIQNTIIN
jgi:hypothetical protein